MGSSDAGGEGDRRAPMKPAGYVLSVRGLPSTLIRRCIRTYLTSLVLRAYFSRLRSRMIRGRHSRSLWGPVDGRGAQTPPSLSSIQCRGAFSRLRWRFGPRAILSGKQLGRAARCQTTSRVERLRFSHSAERLMIRWKRKPKDVKRADSEYERTRPF